MHYQETNLIVYAVNVHTGGGKVLLDEVLSGRPFGNITAAFLDQRYSPPANLTTFKFKNSIWERLKAELKLHQYLKNNSAETILFFGNLPPFLKPKNHSVLYLQNCYLTRQVPLPKDSFKLMLRCWAESLILRFFSKHMNQIWVQTKWMKTISNQTFPKIPIELKPFLPEMPKSKMSASKDIDLMYVGSLAAHKRLNFLLEALNLVDQQLKNKITIKIVLDCSAPISQPNIRFKNMDVEFLYKIDREQIYSLYARSKNFVTTSLYESYYLPLYEAHFFGCHLVAPKTGYTQDLDFPVTIYDTDSLQDLSQKLLVTLINF